MSDKKGVSVTSSAELGAVFAAIISYGKWHSFWWMCGHSLLSWLYVIYFYAKGY